MIHLGHTDVSFLFLQALLYFGKVLKIPFFIVFCFFFFFSSTITEHMLAKKSTTQMCENSDDTTTLSQLCHTPWIIGSRLGCFCKVP